MSSLPKTALVLTFLLSLAGNTSFAADVFSFAQLNIPIQIRMNKPWYQVINSQQEWETFFDNIGNIYSNAAEYRTLTDVDFNNYTMVIGGLGGHTGSDLLINDVKFSATGILVKVIENVPGPNCIIVQAITYPTRAILVRKASKPISFYLERNYYSCN